MASTISKDQHAVFRLFLEVSHSVIFLVRNCLMSCADEIILESLPTKNFSKKGKDSDLKSFFIKEQ